MKNVLWMLFCMDMNTAVPWDFRFALSTISWKITAVGCVSTLWTHCWVWLQVQQSKLPTTTTTPLSEARCDQRWSTLNSKTLVFSLVLGFSFFFFWRTVTNILCWDILQLEIKSSQCSLMASLFQNFLKHICSLFALQFFFTHQPTNMALLIIKISFWCLRCL